MEGPDDLIPFEDLSLSQGEKLRILRARRQLSSAALAKLLGISRNTVMAYELGRITNPQDAILLQWCLHTFGRPSDILGEDYAHLDDIAQPKMTELEKSRRERLAEELASELEEDPTPADESIKGLDLLHLLELERKDEPDDIDETEKAGESERD